MQQTRKKEYFVASNSHDGFCSYYEEVFKSTEYDRLFIIKGGSGTGKSYLMKYLCRKCEAIGADIEYIYCSSDPTSLDGAIIEKNGIRIGIIDGTAPHTRCTEYPGVIDELINLGVFWNSEELKASKKSIVALINEKRQCFTRAYDFLGICKSLYATHLKILTPIIDSSKIAEQISRMIGKTKPEQKPRETARLISGRSMFGAYRFRTVENMSQRTVIVSNDFSSATIYLSKLADFLRDKRQSFLRIASPDSPKICEGIYIPAMDTCYMCEDRRIANCDSFKKINMRRFLHQDLLSKSRRELRMIEADIRRFENEAQECLKAAGRMHFELESIYSHAMDFTAKEKYSEHIAKRIITYLGN